MAANAEKIQQLGTATSGGYISIPLASLRADTILEFEMYIEPRPGDAPVLYRGQDLEMKQDVLDNLVEARHADIFIKPESKDAYRQYVEANLPEILKDDSIATDEKSEVLYNSAQGLMQQAMDDPRTGNVIERSRTMISSTVDFLAHEHQAFSHLLDLVSFDYYTYTHSVNVCMFSLALAQRVGFDDREVLCEFGEGTLLHDVGKSQIDQSIVNSTTKLTFEEFEVIKQHPAIGYEILLEQGGLGDMALDVVRHHHEKMHGGGYPDDLRHNKLSPFVRMCTIADIFDALTTQRTYKDAMPTFEALKLMKTEMQRDVDPQLLEAFILLMGSPDE
jgi:putative nucleotidyltransferase with HDIG domain